MQLHLHIKALLDRRSVYVTGIPIVHHGLVLHWPQQLLLN